MMCFFVFVVKILASRVLNELETGEGFLVYARKVRNYSNLQ